MSTANSSLSREYILFAMVLHILFASESLKSVLYSRHLLQRSFANRRQAGGPHHWKVSINHRQIFRVHGRGEHAKVVFLLEELWKN